MKLVGRIALGLFFALILAAVAAGLLPRQWRVERAVTITAAPERIHPFFDELRRWPEWTPWSKEFDARAKWTYAGPDRGVGARAAWDGPTIGKGRMEIIESDPTRGLRLDEAIESEVVNAHARIEFAVAPGGTRVTWTDEGTLPPVVGGLFRGVIEETLGQHLTKALAKLKATVEALPPPPPAPTFDGDAGAPELDGGTEQPAAPDAGPSPAP